jgi:hypothetical protein
MLPGHWRGRMASLGTRNAPHVFETPSWGWRPELHLAHGAEALLGQHPLVALQGIVPRLSSPAEVIGRQPCAIRGQGALAAEKLLTLIEPVQRIDGAIERRKVQLVEAGRGVRGSWGPCPPTAWPPRCGWCRRRCGSDHRCSGLEIRA